VSAQSVVNVVTVVSAVIVVSVVLVLSVASVVSATRSIRLPLRTTSLRISAMNSTRWTSKQK
jgi:hypothetical protein